MMAPKGLCSRSLHTQRLLLPPCGSTPGRAGSGLEQPGLETGVPAYSRGLQLGDLNGPSQPALFCDSMMLTFVQSQAAQSLQQGRAGTCSTLLESSVAGSAVLVWAGVDGSFCPACFLPWELPAHGGSTLQTDTRGVCRSLGHLGLPHAPTTIKMGSGATWRDP